jgi:hypothetical protein
VQLRTHEVAQFKLIDDDDYDPLKGPGPNGKRWPTESSQQDFHHLSPAGFSGTLVDGYRPTL